MVPTPSALVVLLGRIALDRTWFGVALVVAYGLGMAAVLVGAGWLLLRARDAVPARLTGGRAAHALALLPRATAALVIVAGLLIAARAGADLSGR
jgi:ABC-type nickel/cobalt efflux system permease component RcnA